MSTVVIDSALGATSLRLTNAKSRDGLTLLQVNYEYSAIERLLKITPPGSLGIIWGAASAVEFEYYSAKRKLPPSARCISGRSTVAVYHYGIFSHLQARSKYRIQSFLQKEIPYQLEFKYGSGANFFSSVTFAMNATYQEFYSFILHQYEDSRRVKAGVAQEVDALFNGAARIDFSGPMIINMAGSPTYVDLMSIWHWKSKASSAPILICTPWSSRLWPGVTDGKYVIEGELLPLDELVSCVQSYYQMSDQTVKTAFRIWRNSLDYQQKKLIEAGKITQDAANKFASAVADSKFDDSDPVSSYIAPQRVAPLRFRQDGGLLDIFSTHEHSPEEARVRGSARTCINTAGDMADYGGFSNTIPGFQKKVGRITDNLSVIESGEYDDGLIIQFGTEVSALEIRIWAAKEQLGDTAFHEASVFFATAYSLLAQFVAWAEYKKMVARSEIDRDDRAFSAAKDILRDAAESTNVATEIAKERIGNYVLGIDPIGGASTEREGAVVSAENAASQAATQIIEAAKEEGVEIGKEFKKDLRKRFTSGSIDWFMRNISKIQSMATAKNIEWLSSFIDHLDGP